MKAARFYAKHDLRVEDIALPETGEHDVLIWVCYCGVCGTDVHIYEGEKGSAEITPPVTPGHEFSGVVAKVGSAVERVREGDRVCVDPNSYCGKCESCADGRKNMCTDMTGIGTSVDGGFAEYICVDEKQVFPFSEKLGFEAAALTEPLSCCVHGIDLADIRCGETVMVVGTGSIGMMMVQLARMEGAGTVIAVEPNPVRLGKAMKLGADIGINPVTDDTDGILAVHHITKIDKIIDCAGLVSTNTYALHYAGRGATVVFFGVPKPDDELTVRTFEIFEKELTIKGCFVNPDTFSRSLRLLESGRVKTDEIIATIVDLNDINTVFEKRLYTGEGKVLVRCADAGKAFDRGGS